MKKLLVSASGLSIAVLGGQPAFAAGTTAGDSITNTVTVEYQVGGVDQTDVTAADTFVVDRKVNIVVAEQGNATTSVAPNETDAVTAFEVTNSSNDWVDVSLAAVNSSAVRGSDNFDVTTIRVYEDDGDGVFDSDDTVVTYLDELAADETRLVFVVANVPDQGNGDVAGVRLTGTAREGSDGTTGSQGNVITESASNDQGTEDTVFADADGTYDGIAFANDDYTVAAAALSAVKISEVLATSYPIAGATEFFNIPGARVQYCIVLRNAAGGASATGIVVTDPVPGDTTLVSGSIRLGGTYDDNSTPGDTSDDSCTAGATTAGTSFDGSDVTATVGTLAAGSDAVVTFEATID